MPSRPHILHVLPTLGAGGMELALARVARALSSEMRHSICCLRGQPLIADRFGPEVEIVCLDAGRHDPSLPCRLRRLIRRLAPTAIHARNWGAWPDVAVARLTLLRRPPLIFSFHGLDDPAGLSRRRRVAFRMLARITTRIFTVSAETRRLLIEDVGLPGAIDVIPNGVDTERFSPAPPRAAGGPYGSSPQAASAPFVIGAAGGLTPVKNQALLIRAVADLASAGRNVELRLAGDGPLRNELAALARACGAESRIHLLGRVDDMPTFLCGLDVFALTSDSEAHPNALLEAMACGLPCVATGVGGVTEALDNGQAGVLVPPGDRDALVRALAELFDQPQRRHALAHAARDRACLQFSLERMLDAYRKLYENPRGQ